jgi:RNA-directed DNA polymerase
MSIKLTADDATLVASFASLRTLEDVALLLEVSARDLRFYLYKANRYRRFQIAKKSGGIRTIYSPDNALKIIQRKLNQVLHAVYKGRAPVHGFAKRKSILSNAKRHVGCKVLLNLDIADFFPSIHFGRVKGMFQGRPYSLPEPAALALAQICCYDRSLPAGAPTSPVVANMVCARMDSQLKGLASRFQCTYTRYADDISFSTTLEEFPVAVASRDQSSSRWVVGDQLAGVITDNGFTINVSKTRLYSPGMRFEVTGLTINEHVNVRRKLISQVRAMLNAREKYGLPAAQAEFTAKYDSKKRAKSPADFDQVLRGKIDFIGFIRGRDDALFLKLLDRYSGQNTGARIPTITLTNRASNAVIAQAIWLLEDEEGFQGTAFAAEGYGLLTAWHVAEHQMIACRPLFSPKTYKVTVVRKSEETDLAQLRIDGRIPVQLAMGDPTKLKVGDMVTLAGFPNYHVGDSVNITQGPITQTRKYMGVPHFVIQPAIIRGNSGGPILDTSNRVVGVAVKGQGTPGRFSHEDELSSFVPTTMLTELK